MFDRARLRLTTLYAAVIATIVVCLSLTLYAVVVRLHQAEGATFNHAVRRGISRLFAADEQTLAAEIALVDLGIFLLVMVGGYILAGRTLRPIQRAMERQQRFAVAASHELRTPLTVLQGTMDVALLKPRSPAEYQDTLRQASAEAGRMGRLIANLLMLARTQGDRETLAVEPIDLHSVVTAAVDGLRPLAEARHQTLTLDAVDPLPVRGDRLKLQQAVANVVDNAVSYTPDRGAIHVVGRRERTRAVVEVRDTGPGIASEHLPRVFEPFYRVDPARSNTSAHAGLGLALASWVVEAHGGKTTVDSRPGVGSVFRMTLPLDDDSLH